MRGEKLTSSSMSSSSAVAPFLTGMTLSQALSASFSLILLEEVGGEGKRRMR